MSYTLVTTRQFERRAKKFLRKHPELNSTLAEKFDQLRQDPFQPSLKLHPLSGKLEGLQSVSLTHSYRLILTVQIIDEEIVLLDIGSHDDVYR